MSTSQLNMSRGSRSYKKATMKSFNVSMASINPNTTMESFHVEVRSFMSKRRISRRAWWAFIFLTVANVMTLLTSIAPGWAWTREVNGEFETAGEYYGFYGIWYICWESIDGNGERICELIRQLVVYDPNAFIKAVQALSVITVICGFVCFITLGAYMCIPLLNNSFKVLHAYIAVSSITVVVNFAFFTTYGASFLWRAYWCCDTGHFQRELVDYGLSYCFGLSCIGAIAFIITAACGGSEMSSMKRELRLARKRRRASLRHYDIQEQRIIDPQAFMAYQNQLMMQYEEQ